MTAGKEDNIWIKVFERPKNVVSRKIAGELFVVPIAGRLADMQRMFALTTVAEFIWDRLDGQRSLGDIRDDLLGCYEIEKEQVDADVEAFVNELITEGLLWGGGNMTTQCHETKWPATEEYLQEFIEKAERLRIPLSGSLELTHRCNLNCVHCYLGPQAGRQAHQDREMGSARIHSLIDEMTEAGCMNLLITGGEPLLREDFSEIYCHAKENGLLVTLFSNGTLVTDKIVDLLCELPPVEVEISIYGSTAEVYESITRVPGSYEKCIRGIRALLERGIRVNLKTILMTINRHELFAMENMAKELGVSFRFDAAISPCINGDNTPINLRVSPEEAIEKEMSDPGKVQSWKKFFERFKGRTLGSDLYGCGAGLTGFHIDPFGCLFPCMMAPDMGYDTAGVGFKTVWDNIMPRIRDKKAGADFACRGCVKINVCGYCPGFFRLENGLEDVRSEYLCQMGSLRFQYINEHVIKGEQNGQP